MIRFYHRQSPITIRLMTLTLSVLIFMGGLLLFGAFIYGQSAVNKIYDQLMRGATSQIAEAIYIENNRPILEIPSSAFELLGFAEGDHVFYNVVDNKGNSLAGYNDFLSEFHSGEFRYSNGKYRDFKIRLVTYGKSVFEDSYVGEIGIIIGQTTEAREALAREITVKSLYALGILGIFVVSLIFISISITMRPLRSLEIELQSRDPLDFTPIKTVLPREMSAFQNNINQFLFRLKRRIDSMQKIIADSTHQIRTPIAAIRAQAELSVNYENKSELKENKLRIAKQARELSRLSEQLLAQALVTHRADIVEMGNIDLRRVVLDAEKKLNASRLWSKKQWKINLSETECNIKGDHFSLCEAVKNLLTNALEYGKSPVLITVLPNKIIVADQGNGFSTNLEPKGYGRGLQIVREVMSLHNGKLEFENEKDKFAAILQF